MSKITEEEFEKELSRYSPKECKLFDTFKNYYNETTYEIAGRNAYSTVDIILSNHEDYDLELVIPYDATGNNSEDETAWVSVFRYILGPKGLNLKVVDVDIQDHDITIYYKR